MSNSAQEKQSFLIYKSFYEPIKHLTDEELGKLFRAIYQYQLTGEIPEQSSILMAFMFFKNQFDLDNVKYDKKVEILRENGKKGGRPKKPNESKENHLVFEKAKKPVKVKDKVKDKDIKYNLETKDGYFAVSETYFGELQHTYQFVDCHEEFRKMVMWLKSNTSKQKTNRGMPRFINSWLSRQADKIPQKNDMSYAEIGNMVRQKQQDTTVTKVLSLEDIKKMRQEQLIRREKDVHTKH